MRCFISILCILSFQYSGLSQNNLQDSPYDHIQLDSSQINVEKARASISNYLDHLDKIGEPFSGLLYIYNEEGEIFYQSRGFANAAFKVETDRNTAYNLASVSKMFAALVILKMQEEGLIDINAPIGNYIDEFDKTDIGELTMYGFLTHTSGLPETYENYLWEFVHLLKHEYHQDSLFNHLKDVKIEEENKGQYDYTNLGAILSSIALERVTGKPYKSLLEKYVIHPLDLQNTGFAIINDEEEITLKKASNYEYYNGNFFEVPFAKVGLLGGAAGLHASANDLQKILNATFFEKEFLRSLL